MTLSIHTCSSYMYLMTNSGCGHLLQVKGAFSKLPYTFSQLTSTLSARPFRVIIIMVPIYKLLKVRPEENKWINSITYKAMENSMNTKKNIIKHFQSLHKKMRLSQKMLHRNLCVVQFKNGPTCSVSLNFTYLYMPVCFYLGFVWLAAFK